MRRSRFTETQIRRSLQSHHFHRSGNKHAGPGANGCLSNILFTDSRLAATKACLAKFWQPFLTLHFYHAFLRIVLKDETGGYRITPSDNPNYGVLPSLSCCYSWDEFPPDLPHALFAEGGNGLTAGGVGYGRRRKSLLLNIL